MFPRLVILAATVPPPALRIMLWQLASDPLLIFSPKFLLAMVAQR
jgi:hypothetical protein